MATIIQDLKDSIAAYRKASIAVTSFTGLSGVSVDTVDEVKAAIQMLADLQSSLLELSTSADNLNTSLAAVESDSATSKATLETDVANLTGEVVAEEEFAACESDQFQGIRFYDGTSFGYMRVFPDKVQLLVDEPLEFALDGTITHTYRLTGRNGTLKLYVDGQLAIDATDKFNQPTASKLIEFGDISGRNQSISSYWNSFKYTTTGAFPPANTEDLLLEQTITFPEASVGRLKSYKDALYAAVNPADPDKSSSIYRFEEGKTPEHRAVLAITKASVSAVVIDPNRPGSIFDTSGKYIGTDNGLQYIIGSKPAPFDLITPFSQTLDGNGWLLDSNCDGSCENLLSGVLTIDTTDEVSPRFHRYIQNLPSDSWVKNAKNPSGWTVEVKVKMLDDGSGNVIDAKSSAVAGSDDAAACGQAVGGPDGLPPPEDNIHAPGIYINDGKYQEFVQFFAKGVRLKYARIFGTQILTDQFYTVRIIAKNKAIAVYAKGDNEQTFKRILFAPNALGVSARPSAPQERPDLFVDEAGILHSVWQESSLEGIGIFYSRLNKKTVVAGGGIIGRAKFDPENNILSSRPGLGLPPAADIDYKKVSTNTLISPTSSFVSKGVKAGDILQIFGDGSPVRYVIKKVIDEVLIALDTSDDLSEIGPAEWLIVSGDVGWSPTIRVASEPLDSENPRLLYHSSSNVYVVYDNNQSGNTEIYIRRSPLTAQGTNWSQVFQVTSSSHTARNPDLAELLDGSVLIVWQDSSNDATGSQIFYTIVPPDLDVSTPASFSLTEDALHARNPKVTTDGDDIIITYEDDSATPGKFEIYAITGTHTPTSNTFAAPVKISSAFGSAQNADQVFGTVAWDEVFADGKTEIVYSTLTNSTWSAPATLTNSRGNSRRPVLVSGPAPAITTFIFESDRTRDRYFDLYSTAITTLRDGTTYIPADMKLKTYLTNSYRASAAVTSDNNIALVWEGNKDGKQQSIYATSYDGFKPSMDEIVLAYFPLDEENGTLVNNAIVKFDTSGFVEPLNSGTAFHAADVYTVPAPLPGVSLFTPSDERAFDLGKTAGDGLNGGFSIETTPLIGSSGAIDMFVTPNWASSSIDQHVFFGNGPLDPDEPVVPDTIVFGVGPEISGNSMRLRIVDSLGDVHETIVDDPILWDAGDTVHLRAVWDSTNIGVSSILATVFPSANIGYSAGTNGSIYKTTDGGTTWTRLSTGISYDIYALDFLSNTVGFAAGELGTVLLTTDGGTTWTIVETPVTTDLKGIYFISSSIGIAVGGAGTILKTDDSGASWAEISSDAVSDFTGVAEMDSGALAAVGHKGQFFVSSDDGDTWTSQPIEDASGEVVSTSFNAISKTHQGGTFTTYIVGNAASIFRTTNSGVTWEDVSTAGPDFETPDLFSVSHGSTSSTVWIPWGTNQIAYSTASADLGSLTFVDTTLNGSYRSVEANYGGTSSGAKVLVTGIGGNLMTTADSGVTQTYNKTVCANMTIFINGKEPEQHREGDCSFLWEPGGKSLYFGDYRETGRILKGEAGSTAVDSIMDEVVIYSTPSPGNSSYIKHEFKSKQLASAPIITDGSGKRIEFGGISSFVKSKTQWKEFKIFYCGAIEPLQHFAWDTTCGLVDDVVFDLALDNSGGLWIATANGISTFDINLASEIISDYLSGRTQPKLISPLFTNYTNLSNNLLSDEVVSITADENGDIWAATSKGLMLFERSVLQATQSLNDPVDTIAASTAWTLSDGILGTENPPQFTKVEGLPSDNILVVRAVKGAVLVGTDRGLVVIKRPLKTPNPVVDTTVDNVQTETTADVTTGSTGADVGAVNFAIFTTKDGLPSNRIQSIAQESTGAIWVGTDRGLVLFKGADSVSYSTNNGLISRDVSSVTIDLTDRKFVGTGFGLTRMEGTTFRSFPPASGIGSGAINAGAQDGAGILWFATSKGLVEMNEKCSAGVRFTTYDLQDGIIGDNRIRDYERYRILGGEIPTGGCEKALVTVAVNGRQLSGGFKVDPFVPWIIFDIPLTASDIVDVCVQPGWRKVHDFNFDKKSKAVNQAVIETNKSIYKLFRKRMGAGSVVLGGNFEQGASNTSTMQYSVFAAPLPGLVGPVIGEITKPDTAVWLSTVSIGDNFYSDISDSVETLPQELLEAEHIALDSTDADEITDDYLNFTLLVDSIVYVAYDSRSSSLPSWLRAFEPVPVLIRVSDMEVFTDGTQQEKLFVSTRGSNGCVYDILHAPEVCDVSAQIAIDVTPPEGCATISKVNSKTSFTLALEANDAVTGVTEMQIAPRQDGTTNGTIEVPFIPFQTNYTFELPPEASATTGDVATVPPDTVAGGTTIPAPAGIVNNVFHDHLGTLLVGTKNPGRVYTFAQATAKLTLLFETGEDEVLCMATFGKDLIVGTGTNGKAFRWDGTTLTQLSTSIGERVLSAWVFANKVFLGYSPGGEVYTLDQFGVMQLFKNTLETAVTSFATFGSRLYWSTANETVTPEEQLLTTTKKGHKHFVVVPAGTTTLSSITTTTSEADGHTHEVVDGVVIEEEGHTHGLNGSRSGKIFRYDPATGQPIIIHANTDYAVTALASSSSDSNGLLFGGTSPHGKVLRFIPEEEIFIKSFQTTGLTVNRLRYYTKMYALVDSAVYSFSGTRWEFVASIENTAHDIAPETKNPTSTTVSDQILILRDQNVASTSAAPTLLNPKLCAYVRFKDAAGNVSLLTDDDGKLVECYAPCLDLTGGGSGGGGSGTGDPGLKIGKNRILEVDDNATVLFGLDGTEAFLSGNKVEEEVAVYFSEIFNGTNSFVQWTDLAWDGTSPIGTSITIAVRSATSNSEIVDALWSEEFTDPTANDLTNLTGQFLQFRVTLKSFEVGAPSPVLHTVDIALRTAQAVHYFTTNFVLPDELRRGILTYNGCINPPVTDIVFGITGLDSTDFSDYYVISPDKVFELPSEHQTTNLRVGIKLISSPTEVAIVDEFALLVSLANDAKIRLNLAGQPASTSGQLVPTIGSRTVLTERVQNHSHTITFDASIIDSSNINGATSINAGHNHQIINGIVQQAAGHTHNFTI